MKEQLFCTLIGKMRITTYFVYYLETVNKFIKSSGCKTTEEWIIETCLPDIISTVDSLQIRDTRELEILDAIINLTTNELEQCEDSNMDLS